MIRILLSKGRSAPQKHLAQVLCSMASILANPQCYLETLLHGVKDSMSPEQLFNLMKNALDRTEIPFRQLNVVFAQV